MSVIDSVGTLFEIGIRFLQMIGIPVMAVICLLGFLLILTAGKNPRRKRAGYILTIVFGLCMLLVAYMPLLSYQMEQTTKMTNAQNPDIHKRVDSTGGLIGRNLFLAMQYIAIPITFTTFYTGFGVRLNAAGNPQRKRLGIGLMIFSPITCALIFVMPYLVVRL